MIGRRLLSWITFALSIAFAASAGAPTVMQIEQAGRRIQRLIRERPPLPPLPPQPPDEKPKKDPPEPGQTFAEYLATNPNRPTRARSTIYLLPIGEFSHWEQRLLREIETFLGIFYGTPVKTMDPVPEASLPAAVRPRAQDEFTHGFLATPLVEQFLPGQKPKDAATLVAITQARLWTGKGLFTVFGRTSFAKHVGAISLERMGDPESDWTPTLQRTLKVVVHETAHAFGVFHCLPYECGMNVSASRQERDAAPLAFCAECEMKIWWACGLDPATRTKALMDYCATNGLEEEKTDYERRWLALRK